MGQKNDIQNIIYKMLGKHINAYYDKLERDIELLLRNVIDKPIKGKITKGKLRWRGINTIVYNYMNEPIGIKQRGKLILFIDKEK